MWAILLDTKSATINTVKHLLAAAEKECCCKLRILRTDNGGEFTAVEIAVYCADDGIQRHYSALYSP